MLQHSQPLPNMNQHHLAAQKSQHVTLMNQNQQKMLPVHPQQQPPTPSIPGKSIDILNVQVIAFVL